MATSKPTYHYEVYFKLNGIRNFFMGGYRETKAAAHKYAKKVVASDPNTTDYKLKRRKNKVHTPGEIKITCTVVR